MPSRGERSPSCPGGRPRARAGHGPGRPGVRRRPPGRRRRPPRPEGRRSPPAGADPGPAAPGRGRAPAPRPRPGPGGGLVGLDRAHEGGGGVPLARGRHGVDPRHHLALAHPVAFLDGQRDELAHDRGAHVRVALGHDLARGGHRRAEDRPLLDAGHLDLDRCPPPAAGREAREPDRRHADAAGGGSWWFAPCRQSSTAPRALRYAPRASCRSPARPSAAREALGQAARTALAHPLRSGLGALAMAVGVATVAIVITALQGLADFARATTARTFGSDTFVLARIASPGSIGRRELEEKLERNPSIRRSDLRFLERWAGDQVLYAPSAQTTRRGDGRRRGSSRTPRSPGPPPPWPTSATSAWRAAASSRARTRPAPPPSR